MAGSSGWSSYSEQGLRGHLRTQAVDMLAILVLVTGHKATVLRGPKIGLALLLFSSLETAVSACPESFPALWLRLWTKCLPILGPERPLEAEGISAFPPFDQRLQPRSFSSQKLAPYSLPPSLFSAWLLGLSATSSPSANLCCPERVRGSQSLA